MNRGTKTFKQCLALLLAVILACGGFGGLAQSVSAAEETGSAPTGGSTVEANTTYDVYESIAKTYGNSVMQAILSSGALTGNKTFTVTSLNSDLVTLEEGTLTAKELKTGDMTWKPYTYGENGTENTFDGSYKKAWDKKTVKVCYRLETEYHKDYMQSIFDRAIELQKNAKAYKEAMDKLANNRAEMAQVDKFILTVLQSAINADKTIDKTLQTEFSAEIDKMIAETNGNLDEDDKLKLYNMLGTYETEGLRYYYRNAKALCDEITSLKASLDVFAGTPERLNALKAVINANAYLSAYASKLEVIEKLQVKLDEVQAALTTPDAWVDADSAKLDTLLEALLSEERATYVVPTENYCLYDTLTATDSAVAMIQVNVYIDGTKETTYDTGELVFNAAVEEATVQMLKDKVEAYVQEQKRENASLYDINGEDKLDALVGQKLSKTVSCDIYVTAKEFTIRIDGETDQRVSVNNRTITLPAHTESGWAYTYIVFGKAEVVGQTARTITLTVDQLKTIEGNTYTITRSAFNKSETEKRDKLAALVAQLKKALGEGNVELTGEEKLTVNMAASDLSSLVEALIKGGYSYYGLNNAGLIYDDNGMKMSIQTLIDAVFNDPDFNSDNLVALGKNGKGQLLSATLQLGDSAEVLDYSNLKLVINLTSVPEKLKTALSALGDLSSYMTFRSEGGQQKIVLNLPDKVYGAYLTALVATGYVDLSNINSIDQQIAFAFICDYLDAVINCGADMKSLENTLAMLGKQVRLEKYNSYYKMFSESLSYKAANDGMNLLLRFNGKKTIDGLLSLLGMSDLDAFTSMIAEYNDDAQINVSAVATLTNADRNYCALILDANASGITNKFDCIRTGDWAELNKKTANLAGYSVIILLDDIDGDLEVSGTTILNLNGHNVNGKIKATGKTFIVDSRMDTYKAGTVDGVSGNVIVIGGNYRSDVSACLKDGYYMDGTTVRNAMYYIECDENGNVSFVINSDVYKSEKVNGYLPNVKTMAMDMVVDILCNYATTAGLTINGNTVYDVNFADLLKLLENKSVDALADMLLGSVDLPGMSGVVNDMIADLLDFNALYKALKNGTSLADYVVKVAPWKVDFDRVSNDTEDYVTVSIRANENLAKNFTLSFKVEGSSADYVMNLAKELAKIVEDETKVTINVQQPTYDNKQLWVAGNVNVNIALNMGNNGDYAKILSIILAYGNAAKKDAVVSAITNDDMEALKAVIDNTSVAELFTALKAMNRATDLAAMATAIGLTDVDLTSATALEKVYHLSLVAAGKTLQELDITGMSSKLGNLYNEETGYYELTKTDIFRDGELTARGYSALYELTLSNISLKINLFTAKHAHENAEKIEAQAPTCTSEGNSEYWYCADCGKYFADAECTEEIEENSWILTVIAHKTQKINWKQATCQTKGYSGDLWCSVCETIVEYGTETDRLPHQAVAIPAIEATCTSFGRKDDGLECSVCHEILRQPTKTPMTEHTYSHTTVAPTCTENGYDLHTCTVCGYSYQDNTVPAKHVDANGDNLCDICGEKICDHNHVLTERKEATCTEDGYEKYTCSACGDSYTNTLPATNHVDTTEVRPGKAPTCTESGLTDGTWCSACEKWVIEQVEIPATGHQNVTEHKATSATCESEGNSAYWYCADCGKYFSNADCTEQIAENSWIIPAIGHKNAVEHKATGATCTTAGNSAYWYCPDCDKYFADAACTEQIEVNSWVIPAAHTEELVPGKAATCTETGLTDGKKCSVCGEWITEQTVIPMIDHTEVKIPGKAATCTEAGLTDGLQCSVCEEWITKQTEIPATGHSYGEWVTVTEPTKKQAGEKQRTCSVCGNIEKESIPATADSGLSTWAIIGIVVGSTAIAGGLAFLIIFIIRKRKGR